MTTIFRRKPQSPHEITISVDVGVVVEPDGDGFHVYSPLLKGLHADGKTEEEAVHNFAGEIPAYIISLVKHGESLPLGVVVEHAATPWIPMGAFLRHVQQNVTLPWPSLETSGIS